MDNLGRGYIYILEEERLRFGIDVFLKAAQDRRGLVLTRTPLQNLHSYEDLIKHTHYRLGMSLKDMEVLSPHNIPRFGYIVTNFLKDKRPGIILFEGIEYLTSQNNYQTILRLIQYFYDKVAVSRSIVLMSINPLAFDLKQFHQLKAETDRIPLCVFDDLEVPTRIAKPMARP